MKPAILAVVVIVVLAALMISGGVWFLSPVVPTRELDALVAGQSQAEVKKRVGKPVEILTRGDGAITWRYTNSFHSGYVDIFFETNGVYTYYNYERF